MTKNKGRQAFHKSPKKTGKVSAGLPPQTFDPLTGLPDRQAFLLRLQHLLKRLHREPDYSFAVCFLDLDGFGIVNRRFGHVTGDRFLRTAAARLQKAIPRNGMLARYGGDEFAALWENVGDPAAVLNLARRFPRQLNRALVCGKQRVRIGVSVGVVLSTQACRKPETLLRRADKAMFLAKAQGGNQVVLYQKGCD